LGFERVVRAIVYVYAQLRMFASMLAMVCWL
jgi:hypothetical protein